MDSALLWEVTALRRRRRKRYMYMPAHSRNKIRMIKHIDNVIQHIFFFNNIVL